MNQETIEAIHAHVKVEFPHEACGVICVVKGREKYIPCRNIAVEPEKDFAIDAVDYANAEEQGEIVTIVHSHPNASSRASEADRVQCEESRLPWVIVSVEKRDDTLFVGAFNFIEPNGYQAPLVGRTFTHGLLDCWSLCRDWYEREHQITLPNPLRANDWWDDGSSDLYNLKALKAAGFDEVTGGEDDLRVGDLITMQIRSGNGVANHAAIYLGDQVILHHLYGRLSSRDVYGGYWREVTRSIVRHKDFPNE